MRRTILTSIAVLCAAPSVRAHEFQKLFASDAHQGGRFGRSVAVDRDTLVVGSMWGAYVFERTASGWVETTQWIAPAQPESARFGVAVALHRDVAVVGASRYRWGDGRIGAAFVYERSGTSWTQAAIVGPRDGSGVKEFGTALAVHGDTIVVGARGVGFPLYPYGGKRGRAYVFERTAAGWPATETRELSSPRPLEGDAFGVAVAVHGDTAFVGASGKPYEGGGVVYRYARSAAGWTLQEEIRSSDRMPGDAFGAALALERDTLAVGAPLHGCLFKNGCPGPPHLDDKAGAAYVFERVGGAWVERAELIDPPWYYCRALGHAIGLMGDGTVLAATVQDGLKCNSGMGGEVYAFRPDANGWSSSAEIMLAGDQWHDRFGTSVAGSGTLAFVGAEEDDEVATNAGAVYAMTPEGLGRRYCEGNRATLDVLGSADVADDRLYLVVRGFYDLLRAAFFMGDGMTTFHPPGSLGGQRFCVGGGPSGVLRLGVEPLSWDIMKLDLGTLDVPGLTGGILAGTTWNFQATEWCPGCGPSYWTFSDAVSVTFR